MKIWFFSKRKNPGISISISISIYIKSRLTLIVRVNVVLNRNVVVDSDWRFDNLCGSHLQSQSELFHVSWWYYTLVIGLIGHLRCYVIGRLSVKPWQTVKLTKPWQVTSRDVPFIYHFSSMWWLKFVILIRIILQLTIAFYLLCILQ